MNYPTAVRSLVGMVIAAISFASGGVAKADHTSYKYLGPCYNFHGEAHMIDALAHMDGAALAGYNHHRVIETVHARTQLVFAHREICDAFGRHELQAAIQDLNRFIGSRDRCDLDFAAQHIHAALQREQLVHGHAAAQPIHPPSVSPIAPAPTLFPTQAHRFAPSAVAHPHGIPYGHRKHITLGGKHFRITLGF